MTIDLEISNYIRVIQSFFTNAGILNKGLVEKVPKSTNSS